MLPKPVVQFDGSITFHRQCFDRWINYRLNNLALTFVEVSLIGIG